MVLGLGLGGELGIAARGLTLPFGFDFLRKENERRFGPGPRGACAWHLWWTAWGHLAGWG